MRDNIGTTIREYFELKYHQPFNYSELSPRLKQEAHHLYHTKGGRNLVSMWVQKEKTRLKWESFGLLAGISEPMKENIFQLYKAQAHHMLKEGVITDPGECRIPFPIVRCDGLGKPINGYTN